MKILFLEHGQHDGPLNLAKWARERGHAWSVCRFHAGDTPAEIPEMLIVLGGAMAACDDEAWITREKKFITECIAAGARVLGICLGAQLVAAALGAAVRAHHTKEVGWFPVTLLADEPVFRDFPRELPVIHWHGDTFDLPAGARLLARSHACEHQAFAVGDRVFGVQFHLEVDRAATAIWIAQNPDQFVTGGRFVQPPEEILASPHYGALETHMRALVDRISQID